MAIKLKHLLVAVGTVLVIIGHLGDGTATREVAFWLGVLLSFADYRTGAQVCTMCFRKRRSC